jgi:four helix bundle protein
MAGLVHANRFQDLIVYQKSRLLAKSIFDLTAHFPREEMFSLTSRIRRYSRSVGAQIAEAWAKRRYDKHFISKLSDADGEQMETQHWLESAVDFGNLSSGQTAPLLQQCIEIGKMIGTMMAKADLFCNPDALSLHEEQALYFASTTEP